MFTKEDKQFLNNPIYNLPLEKFADGSYYKSKNGRNGTLFQAYPFSNERLPEVFKNLKIRKRSKVLTVGSSGDQLLYSLYYGATKVTVIDANLYAQPWIEYKMAAIKNLSFDDFLYYFLNDQKTNVYPFDNKVLTTVFHDLSDFSKTFWGEIYLNGYSSEEIFKKVVSRPDSELYRVFSTFYKDEKAYLKLQNILNNNDYTINFINEEFANFHLSSKEKYDLILLSNIKRYVKNEAFTETVNGLFKNNLKSGGIIQLHYEYFNPFKKIPQSFKNLFPNKKIYGYGFKNHHFAYFMQKPSRYKSNNEALEL